MSTKRTYQPSKTRRRRKIGWRVRSSTRNGKKIITRKMKKGRKKLS